MPQTCTKPTRLTLPLEHFTVKSNIRTHGDLWKTLKLWSRNKLRTVLTLGLGFTESCPHFGYALPLTSGNLIRTTCFISPSTLSPITPSVLHKINAWRSPYPWYLQAYGNISCFLLKIREIFKRLWLWSNQETTEYFSAKHLERFHCWITILRFARHKQDTSLTATSCSFKIQCVGACGRKHTHTCMKGKECV